MEREWRAYVKVAAQEYGVPEKEAMLLFEMLGPNEAYDGFITHLEELSEELEQREMLDA